MRKKDTQTKEEQKESKTNQQVSLSRLVAWVVSAFAFTAALFGTLADGRSLLDGCNNDSIPEVPIEKIDVKKVKFKRYHGRYGCTFLYPENWEVGIDNPAAPSADREIFHPTNPEICIVHCSMFFPVEFDDIQDLGETEEQWLREDGREVTFHTLYKRRYSNCEKEIELGKITFLTRSKKDSKVKKVVIKTYTKLENGVFYSLGVQCPEKDYEAYKDFMQYIISSIEFDCTKLENEF